MADGDDELGIGYRSDNIGNAVRLIDVFRNAVGSGQITTGSKEISTMVQELCRFQVASLCSTDDLRATVVIERGPRTLGLRGHPSSGAEIPRQEQVRSIKSQQISASKERERMIQGVQSLGSNNTTGHSRAAYSVLHGFGEDDISITAADSETVAGATGPSTSIGFGPATSFLEAGRQLAVSFTLNQRQSIALRLICRQLDRVRRDERGTPQLCQFVGGEGGTGKSRVIEAIAALFASKGISHRLLVTATSGTAAAQINGITIHSACNLSKGILRTSLYTHVDGIRSSSSGDLYIDGQARMDWQEKWLLIVDEVSMLGARTLHAANEQLCKLRGCTEEFGGIPIVVFCGDFHQFRPVQERSILLPSAAIPWGTAVHGVPSQIYDRLERNEPSASEKARTEPVVPRTERGLEEDGPVDIRHVLAMLGQGDDFVADPAEGSEQANAVGEDGNEEEAELESGAEVIHEIISSGMFALDDQPDIRDAEKLQRLFLSTL
ncbi:PIF1 protein [Pochonia chlamydosporia 170]|uniref:ATP-dependent DNA helicase n=1 Tax=Pochonia chlamydosporia 170 TaxID=1380566 RepID=A0A219AN66_METCM|nr:PIF1 protein [Pochonia chlamydosporia 170]OWT42276.1 PIF1 protein [Pochonia chlamydosporia 170]